MRAFDYLTPATIGQALDVLAEHGDDAKVLAGGQSLVPLLNYRLARPRVVVDVNALPLDRISVAGDRVTMGALTRHATLEESVELARACPLLREAAALIGNVRVRTLGTLGGSLAHADPAAELPMAMVALDARFDVAGRAGRRTVAARDFFTGYLTTGLAPDELLVEVEIPTMRGAGWAVEELSRRAGDFAIVAVTALIRLDARGRVDDVRIAFGGVGPTPVRVAVAEDLLLGAEPTPERLGEAADAARDALNPESDAFVSAGYRRLLAGVLARRALTRAVTRAMEIR
ncbi:MAG TPA: xanthine dehydrogenase family protein subunit M [Candidatus Acidoferrum sp.]|nr:xanthine dehydrogenase family protein subunit M [Candidatus Acidoferrum sp.]